MLRILLESAVFFWMMKMAVRFGIFTHDELVQFIGFVLVLGVVYALNMAVKRAVLPKRFHAVNEEEEA